VSPSTLSLRTAIPAFTRSNTPAAFEADKPEQKNASKSVTFGDQFSLTIIDRPKIPKKEATSMSLRAAFQWLSTFLRSL
jgi:hypothetical protein